MNRPNIPGRCVKQVSATGGWQWYQCSRKGTVTRNGKLYCTQHDPVARKERDDRRYTERLQQRNAEKAEAILRLAALIREVDGDHSLGAAELAEALVRKGVRP